MEKARRSLFVYNCSIQLASMKITFFFFSLAGQPWRVWTVTRLNLPPGSWGCAALLGTSAAALGLGAQGEQTTLPSASPHAVYFINTE